MIDAQDTQGSTEHATGPVPENKTCGWHRVAIVSAMVGFSMPTFVTGVQIFGGADGNAALIAIVAGGAILTVIGAITGTIGARTRLSSYMLSRIAFGNRGAMVINLAFALSLLGWFGVNIDLFSGAVLRLLQDEFGVSANIYAVEFAAGALMTFTTLYGFRAINALSLVLVPVLAVVTVILLHQSLGTAPLVDLLPARDAAELAFGDAISVVVGTVIVGAVILPDITRFIREWYGAALTAILSYLIVNVVVMLAGGLAAVFVSSSDFLAIMIAMGIGLGAFAIVIFGSWVLNSLNLYSASLSSRASLPQISRRTMVLVLGALGTLAAFADILDFFLDFLFYLAVVFVPVAGVIAVDYMAVRPAAYRAAALQRISSIEWAATVCWALGAVVALLGAGGVLVISGIAAIDAMAVSALSYFLLRKLIRTTPRPTGTPGNPDA